MSVLETTTLSVTIDAPFKDVTADLADPTTHPEWATEFFAGPVEARGDEGELVAEVPMMGGRVRFAVAADVDAGTVDLYLAPVGVPFGPPLPVRVIPNGDGVDVLWTLTRYPGTPEAAWEAGVESMRRELDRLRDRHESRRR